MIPARHSRVPRALRQSALPGSARPWLRPAAAMLALCAATRLALAQVSATDTLLPPPVANAKDEVLPASSDPFRPGESLRFTVQYGPIHAGSAWLEVKGSRDSTGHAVDTLVAR